MPEYCVTYSLNPLRNPQIFDEPTVEAAIRRFVDLYEESNEEGTVTLWAAEAPLESGGTATWHWQRFTAEIEIKRTVTVTPYEPPARKQSGPPGASERKRGR